LRAVPRRGAFTGRGTHMQACAEGGVLKVPGALGAAPQPTGVEGAQVPPGGVREEAPWPAARLVFALGGVRGSDAVAVVAVTVAVAARAERADVGNGAGTCALAGSKYPSMANSLLPKCC